METRPPVVSNGQIEDILRAHHLAFAQIHVENARAELDEQSIDAAMSAAFGEDLKCEAAMADIESQLMDARIVPPGRKRFHTP